MYLSNAEREALFLTGYPDPEAWVVEQALEQALARGTYVPGEESLRVRLEQALDYEARMEALREQAQEEALREQAQEERQAAEVVVTEPAPQEPQEGASEPEPVAEEPEAPAGVAAAEPAVAPVPFDSTEEVPAAAGVPDVDLASMTKAEIVAFALEHFGVQLDGAERKDDLIVATQRLIDQADQPAPF